MADDTESIFGFKLTGQNARPDMNLFNFKLWIDQRIHVDVFWNYPFQAHEFIFSTFLYYVEFYNTITEVQITLPLPLPPIWLSMCVMLILRSIMVAGHNPCAKIRVLQY